MWLLPLLVAFFSMGLLLPAPLAGGLLVTALLVARRPRSLRVPALAFLLGSLVTGSERPTPLATAFPEGAPLVRLTGRVADGPDLPVERFSVMTLDVEEVEGSALSGRIRVQLPEGSPLPSPGARVTLTGSLVRPRPPENPGEPARARSSSRRSISHFLPVRTPRACVVLEPGASLDPRVWVHRLRNAIERRLIELPDRATGDFLACLVLGRRDRIPDSLVDSFRRSGTVHFLAISGLHVGMLAGLLWLLLRPLPAPPALSAILVAGLTLTYAAVTGMRPPAARAALLVALAALGFSIRRRPRPLILLSGAALVILAVDPTAIHRPGFQLSFTAVLSILALSRPIEEGLFPRAKLLARFTVPRESPWILRCLAAYVRNGLPVSLAAWLGTAPVLLSHFGSLSLLVVPANLIVFPFILLLFPLGLLTAVTGIVQPAAILVHSLVRVVTVLGALPFALVWPPPPSPLAIVLYYGLLLLAARRPRLGRRALVLLLLALSALASSGVPLRRLPRTPRLTVLSVGHGLAIVLETPEGGVLLYDAGSLRRDVFRRFLHPFLRHRRIWSVDHLVVSHDDADHTNDVPALLRACPVDSFHPPGTLHAGVRLTLPGAEAEVLWPPRGATLSDNDSSVILRVRAGPLTALFTGDAETDAILGLLRSGRDLTADVLVVPHHGRPQPEAGALLAAVQPKLIVSSDGPRDPLDPAYEGALRTSERGAIIVTPGPRVRTFR